MLALAEDLEGLDRGAQVQDALQRIAATTACHAAVKANYPLTYEKMTHILDELRATAYSTVCPHGRPVMLRLTRREIEKNFDGSRRGWKSDGGTGAGADRLYLCRPARAAHRYVAAAGRLFTAGPLGPDPKLFGAGVVVFLAGWGLTRLTR